MANSPLFHRAHYNIIAARIREEIAHAGFKNASVHETSWNIKQAERTAPLCRLATSLAKRFCEDNPNFDPIKFLEACSPDNDLYPLTELWIQDPNYP